MTFNQLTLAHPIVAPYADHFFSERKSKDEWDLVFQPTDPTENPVRLSTVDAVLEYVGNKMKSEK